MYICKLQNTSLGLLAAKSNIRILGDCGAPALALDAWSA